MIMIDYLQLMDRLEVVKRVVVNREQEISTISRNLKAFSKRELKIPVIALSQLSPLL